MNCVEKINLFGLILLITGQVWGHPGHKPNDDHLITEHQDDNVVPSSNSADIREYSNVLKTLMQLRNAGKKAQDPPTAESAAASPTEIRDLHELVRAVIERDLAPVVQQILSGLNVPTLFGQTTEAPVTVPPSNLAMTTTKQYIYLHLQGENPAPEPVLIPGTVQFQYSPIIPYSSPNVTTPATSSDASTVRGKYRIRNKIKINGTDESATGTEPYVDDEDEADVVKKLEKLP